MMGKEGPKYSQLVQLSKRYGIMIARKKHEGRNALGNVGTRFIASRPRIQFMK